MRRGFPSWAKALLALGAVLGLAVVALRVRYGGGKPFPNRVGEPTLGADALEVVAELDLPPGNVAVSRSGRVFFTFHPDASPEVKVAELVDGKAKPFPSLAFQSERDGLWFDAPLSLRIDREDHLWVLDQARHGVGDTKLLEFDIDSGEVLREVHFDDEAAGLGSHLNDFAVHPDGDRVYIAEASIFGQTPALLVYRLQDGTVRRLLEGHPSVQAEPYYITVDGEPIEPFGLFAVRPGVDSIALDRNGEYLYFGAVTATKMYRAKVSDLDDPDLPPATLADRVEVFGDKTQSDGITTDDEGRVYLTDPEHDAIVAMNPDGSLETLLVDARLRWPDGLSFGPDGWLYVTSSALQHVIAKGRSHVEQHAPYHIFRLRPGTTATPGH